MPSPNDFEIVLFLNWLRNKGMAESTVREYEYAVSCFLIKNPDIHKLEDYNNFLIEHTVKKRNYAYFGAIRHYVRYKITDETKKRELLEGMIRPQKKTDYVRERKYLSEERIFDVINHLKYEKHRVIAIIMTLTGIRIGDVLRLKRGKISNEIYENHPVLRLNILGKRQKRNVIFIHDELAQEIISNYIINNVGWNDYYFTESPEQHKKSPYSILMFKMSPPLRRLQYQSDLDVLDANYEWFRYDLQNALIETGINKTDFAAHDYRRCFARRVWERYKDVHILQGLLNHNDAKTSLRYLDASGLKNVDYHYEMQMGNKKSSQ